MVLGLLKNHYYKYPEGTHPWQKVRYCTQAGFLASCMFGLYDVHLLSSPNTLKQAANSMAFWVIPITSICAVGSSVKYLSASYRNKDDEFNCIPAVIACAPILQVWLKRSYAFNLAITGIATLSMMIYENLRLDGIRLIVRQQPMPREIGIDCTW